MRGLKQEFRLACPGGLVVDSDAIEDAVPVSAPPEAALTAADTRAAVHRFVSALPQGLMRAARLVVLEGHSRAQAARALGLSRTAVTKKMSQVRDMALIGLADYVVAN